MTLEKFTEHMGFVIQYGEKRDKMYDYLSDYVLDTMYEPLDHLITMIGDMFNDKSDWIGYWIYELDFGVGWKEGMVTINDVDVKMKTIEDLYIVLMDNKERNEV